MQLVRGMSSFPILFIQTLLILIQANILARVHVVAILPSYHPQSEPRLLGDFGIVDEFRKVQ